MSEYFYKAKDKNSKIISGKTEADSFSVAAANLEQKGLIVLEIIEDEKSIKKEQLNYEIKNTSEENIFSVSEKAEFFNAFYFMYKSGLPVSDIFSSIFNSSKNHKIKSLCLKISKKIEKGLSLKEAFSKQKQALGTAYTALIIAGEESGNLDKILLNIINDLKKEEEFKKNFISAFSYPFFIFCMAIAVLLLFKLFILKAFESIGTGGLSHCVIMKMLTFAVIQIIIFFGFFFGGIFYIYKNKKLQHKIINFITKLKLVENILKNFCFYNFFTILSLSSQAGITSAEAINLANDVISVENISLKLKKAQKRVQNGCLITTAFSAANVFSRYDISQISTGEKSGELDKMYSVIAHNYEEKINSAIKILSKMLEPIFLILVGIIVGYVVLTGYRSYYSNLLSL